MATLPRRLTGRPALVLALLGSGCAVALAGCGVSVAAPPGTGGAVGAENEYANVISQIGGRYVTVSAIESNPNTDPHTFEASPSVAAGGRRGAARRSERRSATTRS